MAVEWRNVALEDVADELTVGYVGPMATEYVPDGIPFLRSLNVEPLRINKDDLKFITPEFHQRIQKSRLRPGDVVIVRTGKPGACSVVPAWLVDANCSDLVIVRCGKELNNRFLAYYVNTVAAGHVAAHLVGAVQQHFNVGSARTLRLNLPPLPHQEAIASVLGALDDKIELNRRMNATLDAMARALFQSWFVDFDPVRARLDGRPPAGVDEATASLFPPAFQDTNQGPIPCGWKAGALGELISSARERIGARADAVVLSAISTSELVRSDEHFNKQVYSESINNYLSVRQWDFAYNPSRINIGSIGMLKEDLLGAVSPVYEVFTPSAGYHWFVERFLSLPETKSWIETLCSGSVRQSLKLKDLRSVQCVIPPLAVVDAFNQYWERLYALIKANSVESQTLAALRDALLPKLLSGELRVGVADEVR